MNRNTILYILVALLVIGGVTWLVVARTSEDRVTGDVSDEDSELDTDEVEGEDGEDEETEDTDTTDDNGDSSVVEDGDDQVSGGTGTDTATPGTAVETPHTGGIGEANGALETDERLSQAEIETRLELQLALFEALVTAVSVGLEEGEISPEEAALLLDELTEAGEELEEVVELYTQNL